MIEIIIPSNKLPGPDRRAYEAKQMEVLSNDANLIEIDLLCGGQRLLPYPELEAHDGPYTRMVDCETDPQPPSRAEDSAWADQLLRAAGLR